ncbi:hypothetical protein L3Q82_011574 [Scortum barcoo]|uniref:Uncharacterized protein n=1 Tax=Scortum barcoo TaxID=214431 RepID=A0ACB8W9G6_9TELE|nr:hypothetical protein L3Q82_011574 [Scortum barcoo]
MPFSLKLVKELPVLGLVSSLSGLPHRAGGRSLHEYAQEHCSDSEQVKEFFTEPKTSRTSFPPNFTQYSVSGVDMAGAGWGLLLSLALLLSPLGVSAEQQSLGGFRRLYVLQPGPGPGPAGADGGLRVSSISTRHGAAGRPHTYNVELNANFGGQVRTRRMGNQAAPARSSGQEQLMKLSGVNICGGQCCHGWSKAQGSQRCTKPNCIPQCQNGGMCLRPQLCVCKPGSNGKACEHKTVPTHPFPGLPGNGPTNGHTTGHTDGHTTGHTNGHNVLPQRPIPQQVRGYASAPPPSSGMAQMKLTVKPSPQRVRPHYIQQHIQQQVNDPNPLSSTLLEFQIPGLSTRATIERKFALEYLIRPLPMHPGQSQQYVIKPKYYHTHTTHTQTHVQSQPERPIPLTVGDNPIHGDITKVFLLSLPLLLVCAMFSVAVGNHTGRIKVVFTPTICKLTCIGGRCHNNCELGNTTTIISENGHATDTLTAPNFRVVVCHLPCINGGKCSARDKCQCPPNFTGKFCQMPVQNGHQHHKQTSGSYSQTQVHSTHTLPLTYSNGQSPVFSPSIVNIHIKHPPEASVQVHQVSQLDNYHNNGHQVKGSQSGSSSSSTSYSYHHTESSQKFQHHGYNIMYPSHPGYQVPQYQPVTSKNTLGRCFQETAGSQCGKALPGLTKQEQCCGTIGTSWGFHKCQKCPKKPSIPLIDCPQGYKRINSSHCQDLDECQLQGVCPNGNCQNTVGSYRCMCKPGYVPDPTLTTCISNTPAIQEEKGACFRLVSSGRQCLHPVSAQLSKQLCCCSVGKAWGPRCDKCPPPGTAKFREICPGGMGYTVLPNPPVNKPVTVYQEPIEKLPPQPLPTPERPVEAFGQPEEIIPEVVERSSPPAPVEIFPSNAGQDIAPTQSAEVDECQINPYICSQGICYNTAEGYTCHCDEGYRLSDTQTTCVDVDDCLESPSLCFGGRCKNTEGSFLCVCSRGFLVDEEGTSCVDIDECQDEGVCTRGHCQNTEGSFICQCGPGFRVSPAGDNCDDVDECVEQARACDAVGECVNNMGSFTCTCPQGYTQINSTICRDVDECVDEPELCSPHGECLNTEGSYLCLCESGFTVNHGTPSCDDIDECGLNETLCGPHGFCENRLGSFQCLCDQGYQESQDGQGCVDVNECELLSSVCGEAQCMNVDGSFLCVCPDGQDYNVMIAKCEPIPTASSVERKECYHNLNDENLCESVLTSHVTLEECCCTLGAGWGDNCEVHPCPVNGTDQFNQMCPSGRGFIPSGDSLYGVATAESYKDADECRLFGQEVCKGGYCLDNVGSYECYCRTGQDYDPAKLECRDINECLNESVCVDGQCENTDGSYECFCTPPMVLDTNNNRCVFVPEVAELHETEQIDYQGICWQTVTETTTCTRPLGPNRKTTFTECCCLYGEAWGMDCALCPRRHTEDYASMCNIPLGDGRRPYGRDAVVASPVHEYEVSPDYSPAPEQHAAPPFYENEEHTYKAFEGLQAEECGILNGCENGRCVRVQEGYTCDCFDGYTLDLSHMACIGYKLAGSLDVWPSECKSTRFQLSILGRQVRYLYFIFIMISPSYDWMRKLTQRKKQAKKGKASLLFDHLEPMELAEHLTFLEFKSIRRISFTDYQSYVIHGCLVDNPTLERSIALFNGVSQWVQLMVLSKLTPLTRAEVITKYIHVAQTNVQIKSDYMHSNEVKVTFSLCHQKLLQLQNFNTLMAVVGGLSHSSISRLKETHSYLAPEVVKIWSEMTDLVSSNNNYSCYRKAFNECQGFKIPILGVHLKDLIAVHVVFPDWVDDSNKMNLVKMHQLYMTFNELVSLQSVVAQVEPNMDLIYLLTLSLDLYYTEEEIYELSLLREPRNPKSLPTSPTTPNKPLAPLDWASGVTTKPDPSLVNKHIRKVVDSVFRNYDHDHDGYISQEDFESIAANFPFLDSFCVLDKDQDGLISKDEMIAYFLRANPLLQCKMGPGFVHNFQEMTYLKPTFCEHCAGFVCISKILTLHVAFFLNFALSNLWGIIKQGYKCKDCGVNCHKQCRELLILACRKLIRSSSLGSVSPARLTHSSLPSSPALPTCKDEDEVFEFPAVTSAGPALDTQSITLMTGSAQRISVRLQRATTSQATQTEPLWPEHTWGATDGGSHTFPKMKYRTRRKTSKNKGFARWENRNDGQHQAVSSRCSMDSQEKSNVSEELFQNGITHRGKKMILFPLTCPDISGKSRKSRKALPTGTKMLFCLGDLLGCLRSPFNELELSCPP